MTIFKRPDKTYLIGIATHSELGSNYYFLNFRNNVWTNVSTQVIPDFSDSYKYQLPRFGTRIKVFNRKFIVDDSAPDIKSKYIYDLEWKKGLFSIKR